MKKAVSFSKEWWSRAPSQTHNTPVIWFIPSSFRIIIIRWQYNNGDASLCAVWGAVWSIKCKNNNNNNKEASNDDTRKKEQRNFKWFKFSFDFFSFRNDNCVDEDCKYIGSHNVGVCRYILYYIYIPNPISSFRCFSVRLLLNYSKVDVCFIDYGRVVERERAIEKSFIDGQ